MMKIARLLTAAGAVTAAALGASGCAAYAGSAPAIPAPTAARPSTIVIDILGINGAMSFSPNPVAITPGQPIIWHNADSVPHRVVFNDGEVDTGNIAPGASSTAMGAAAAGPYHCSIHPEMVGTTVKPG